MAFLNNILISLKSPTGFWPSIIGAFEKGVGIYFLAIILLTLCIKVILLPFDFLNRRNSRMQMEVMAKMRPELTKLQQKYGNNFSVFNQKRMELYKKYNHNQTTSCLVQFIYMVLSSLVFITLCTSMTTVSSYKITVQYQDLKTTYANVLTLNEKDVLKPYLQDEDYNIKVEFDENEDGEKIIVVKCETKNELKTNFNGTFEYIEKFDNSTIVNLINKYTKEKVKQTVEEQDPGTVSTFATVEVANPDYNKDLNKEALRLTFEMYEDTNVSFLWVTNIWKAESPFTNPIFSVKEIKSNLNKYYSKAEKKEEKKYNYEEKIYDAFMPYIDENESNVNGYLLLAFLIIGISIASVKISQISTNKKKKNEVTNKNQQSKEDRTTQIVQNALTFALPCIMGIVATFTTCIFAIYLITGQLFALATTPLMNLIIDKLKDKQDKKRQEEVYVDYRRK